MQVVFDNSDRCGGRTGDLVVVSEFWVVCWIMSNGKTPLAPFFSS